jgi:hypothetical protein
MKQLFADAFVDQCLAQAGITAFGPSGIGFSNFGLVRDLHLQGLIEIGLTLTGISEKRTKKVKQKGRWYAGSESCNDICSD